MTTTTTRLAFWPIGLPHAEAYKSVLRDLLLAAHVQVNAIERIAPTLEDVFISSVSAPSAQRSLPGHVD
jgi:hypothetical protein